MNLEQIWKIKNDNDLYVAQNFEELEWLINEILVRIGPPKVVLEIGVEKGGTLKYWEQISTEGALIIGVDNVGCSGVNWDIKKSYKDIYCLQGDSHAPDTIKQVKDILAGEQVDFLFIDGDHSYNGVKADYENFSPMVKIGGITAFHDINPHFWPRLFFDTIEGLEEHLFYKTTVCNCAGFAVGYVVMR